MSPRLSGSIVLLRPKLSSAKHLGDFQVLLVQRSKKLKAFSSFSVFPGGVVDEKDDFSKINFSHFGLSAQTDSSPMKGRAIAKLAGIRELFEESGILLYKERFLESDGIYNKASSIFHNMGDLERRRWQEHVHADAEQFYALLDKVNAVPALNDLNFWATFISPKPEKHRFIAHFFIAVLDYDAKVQIDEQETTGYTWLTPQSAIEQCNEGILKMLPPQYFILNELSSLHGIDEVLQRCPERAQQLPIRPHFVDLSNDEVAIVYPGDELHDIYPGKLNNKRRMISKKPIGIGGYQWICNLKEIPNSNDYKQPKL